MSGIHEGPSAQPYSIDFYSASKANQAKGTDISLTGFSTDAVSKTVSSLCPVCRKVVSAHIFEADGKVLMEKQCEEHGSFREVYWADAPLYKKFIKYLQDDQENGRGSSAAGDLATGNLTSGNLASWNLAEEQKGCPHNCGICSNHLTGTLLGIIDLTSRCNMACPICFADAGDDSCEPSLDEISFMMQNLRRGKPVPCPAIQFSGGEPTLRDDLPQILGLAKKLGFSQIQIATNGLRLASSPEFCRSIQRAGLNTAYLQFDGVTPEPYISNRGRDILPIKLKALQNLRKAGLESIVLVPTLAKGINDHQVGDIVKFASKNLDIVRGVNFQPVSFTGRVDEEERAEKRLTIPDFIALLEEQTDGEIGREDFYPISFTIPISLLIAAQSERSQPVFTVHPCCGVATYAYLFNGHLIPLTRFIDVEGLLERIKLEVENFNGSGLSKLKMNGMILKELPKFVDENLAPRDLNITRMLIRVLRSGTRDSLRDFHKKTLFIGTMHFQDAYNIDFERLRRCGIHYALPDGRIIPFCAYNIIYR